MNQKNLLTRSLLGAMGLGMALFGATESVKAKEDVNAGTDYLVTPDVVPGTNFFFPDLDGDGTDEGFINFKGLPINTSVSGQADTVVNRLDAISAPFATELPIADLLAGTLSAENVTRIQIVDLSLESLNLTSDGKKMFVGLTPGKVSGGEMAIAHNPNDSSNGGIWSSYFGIQATGILADVGVLVPSGDNYVNNLIAGCSTATNYTCFDFIKGFQDLQRTINLVGGSVDNSLGGGNSLKAEDEPWSHDGNVIGPNLVDNSDANFFLTNQVFHDSGDGATHTVEPVPEPSATAGLILLGLGSVFGIKRKNK